MNLKNFKSGVALAGVLALAGPSAFAACALNAGIFEVAKATGGSVRCADKNYYQAIAKGQTPAILASFEENCIASGAKVLCKSGTLVEYLAPSPDAAVAAVPAPSAKPQQVLTFTAVNEPPWLDRPAEPGEWYGLSCLVRI